MSSWVRAGKCSEYVAHALARAFADCSPSTAHLAEHFLLLSQLFCSGGAFHSHFMCCMCQNRDIADLRHPTFFLSVINVAHSCSPHTLPF